MPASSFERAVLDALPLTIYTTDVGGRITSTNRAFSRFAADNGGSNALCDEALTRGTSIFDAVRESGPRQQVERAMALLRTGRLPLVSWEFPCDSPDEERVFVMHVTPLHDDDANDADGAAHGAERAVTGFVFSTVNITPSHRAREALIETGIALSRTIDLERVYREVAQHVRRAVGGTAFCLAAADAGDANAVGDGAAPLRVVHHVGYDDEDVTALAARLAPRWRDTVSERRVTVAHSARGIELSAPIGDDDGLVAVMTVLADDIESPERLDDATRVLGTIAAQAAAAIERAGLVRRVEQKRRLEAIGELSAGVAHELRNPLFGISSAAQLLRFRVKDDPVVEKNVGRILREVDRLNRMVTSLLEYGRPTPVRLAPADPDAVWDDVLEAERGRLESKSLIVQRERALDAGPAGATPCCAIDVEQLAQVFLNVLVNAVDAAPEASDLTLVSTTLPSGAWRCRLTNGGAVIPPETVQRAFEIFYSTKAGGTGIGLALCQRIVDEHRGSIALDADPAGGAILTITLPPAA